LADLLADSRGYEAQEDWAVSVRREATDRFRDLGKLVWGNQDLMNQIGPGK